MKPRLIFIVLLSLFIYTGCFAAHKTVSFNIIGKGKINKTEIKKTLKKQEGVLIVKVSVKNALVTITYEDKKTSPDKLMGYLASLGYYASPLGENCANKPGGCLNNKSVIPNTMW